MMKKLFVLTAIILAFATSGQVSATALNVPGDGEITPVAGDCPALDNNVTVQLSKNVFAGYNCTTTSFQAATCHSNGTNKTTTQTCSWTEDTDTAGNGLGTFTPNFTACGTDPTATNPDGSALQVEYTGRIGFRGTSGGGTVGPFNLTQPSCDANTVLTMVPD